MKKKIKLASKEFYQPQEDFNSEITNAFILLTELCPYVSDDAGSREILVLGVHRSQSLNHTLQPKYSQHFALRAIALKRLSVKMQKKRRKK